MFEHTCFKFTVSGRSKEAYNYIYIYTCVQCSHASVRFTQACPNYTVYSVGLSQTHPIIPSRPNSVFTAQVLQTVTRGRVQLLPWRSIHMSSRNQSINTWTKTQPCHLSPNCSTQWVVASLFLTREWAQVYLVCLSQSRVISPTIEWAGLSCTLPRSLSYIPHLIHQCS